MLRGRRKWAAAVAFIALLIGGVAFAFFTSSGSGTGTASVGSAGASDISITSCASDAVSCDTSTSVGDLYPGDAGKDLSVWYKNNGSGSEWVGDITGSVANNGNCLGAWFTVDTIHVDASVAPGAQPHAASHIKLNNVNVNQDACQAKSVTINWASDVTNQPTPTP